MTQITHKPVITIAEARKILGKDSISFSDTQIIEVISFLHLTAKDMLASKGSKNILVESNGK